MLMAIMIGGFGFMGSLLLVIWRRIERVEDTLGNRIDKTNERIDKLSNKIEDIDRRLCRIEESVASNGHCLFSQSKPEQKAQ